MSRQKFMKCGGLRLAKFQSEIEPELAAFCRVKNLDKIQSSSSDWLRELLSAGSRNLELTLKECTPLSEN